MTFGVELDDIAALIRRVAEDRVLPRFRRLAAHEIREKTPGSLVTIADVEAEEALMSALADRVPGSLVVGEEAVGADAGVLGHLDEDHPVWVIDPVDGTDNFAKSIPRFCMIVALVAAGRVHAGWIHDPVRDATVMAAAGGGAWLHQAGERRRLRTAAMPALAEARGGAAGRVGRHRILEVLKASGQVGPVHRVSCAGQEYIDLVEHRLDFAAFGRILPWDHAAGVLIHHEAGGVGGFVDAGHADPVPYTPRRQDGALLMAPDLAAWTELRRILLGGAGLTTA
jgi:fructose-1,6-bisphosphatase/inositol monophosphatase family enzyme